MDSENHKTHVLDDSTSWKGLRNSVQEEEGAGAGAAVADIDQRGSAARDGAQRLCWRCGVHAHPQAGRVLPVLQRY